MKKPDFANLRYAFHIRPNQSREILDDCNVIVDTTQYQCYQNELKELTLKKRASARRHLIADNAVNLSEHSLKSYRRYAKKDIQDNNKIFLFHYGPVAYCIRFNKTDWLEDAFKAQAELAKTNPNFESPTACFGHRWYDALNELHLSVLLFNKEALLLSLEYIKKYKPDNIKNKLINNYSAVGLTPLHWAAMIGWGFGVKVLLIAGADPDKRTLVTESPDKMRYHPLSDLSLNEIAGRNFVTQKLRKTHFTQIKRLEGMKHSDFKRNQILAIIKAYTSPDYASVKSVSMFKSKYKSGQLLKEAREERLHILKKIEFNNKIKKMKLEHGIKPRKRRSKHG